MIKVIMERIQAVLMAHEILKRAQHEEFEMTTGDTAPSIEIQFLSDVEIPINLTGCTVQCFLQKADGSTINTSHSTCEIVNAAQGIAKYNWQAIDTASIGIHYASFKIIYADAKVQSLPYPIRINIRPSVKPQ